MCDKRTTLEGTLSSSLAESSVVHAEENFSLQEKSKNWNVDISIACYVHTIMGGTIHPDPLLLKGSTILGRRSHSEQY